MKLGAYKNLKILSRDFPRQGLLGSLLLLLLSLGIIGFFFHSLSFPLVLRFNELQGVVRFGERADFFGMWIAFLALWILNAALAEMFFLRERFISYTLIVLNLFLSLALLASVITVIFAN